MADSNRRVDNLGRYDRLYRICGLAEAEPYYRTSRGD